MKTASVRDLRNEFGLISRWIEAGETVQVLKRGKPFARIMPEPKTRSFLGSMRGTAEIADDLEEPTGVEWNAMQ